MYSEQILAVLEQVKALRLRVFNLLETAEWQRGEGRCPCKDNRFQ